MISTRLINGPNCLRPIPRDAEVGLLSTPTVVFDRIPNTCLHSWIGDRIEADKSILSRYKIAEDFNQLQDFLKKSTKVVEILLNEKEAVNNTELKTHKKSQLEFAKGCVEIKLPDRFANVDYAIKVTSCSFSMDNQQYFVVCCDYKSVSDFYNKSVFVVYNVDEPVEPYR